MAVSMVRNASVSAALGLVGLLLACGSDGGSKGESSDAELIAKRNAKFRECGVLGEGETGPSTALNDEYRCFVERCFLPADCAALKAAMCEWGGVEFGGPAEADSVVACAIACEEDTRLECTNGDFARAGVVCDGSDNCQDGNASDEADCEGKRFACGDGEFVSKSDVCDGEPRCNNEADERECETFGCKSGEQVAGALRCDGEPDCADASDETGCAPSLCGT
jgi:hypothetical protein